MKRRVCLLITAFLAVSEAQAGTLANAAPSAAPASGPAAGVQAAEAEIQLLRRKAAQIQALREGALDAAVSPGDVLDVELQNEAAVSLEVRRLVTLLSVAERPAKGKKDTRKAVPEPEPADPETRLWQARIDLDRARLAFLELPADEREKLLAAHRMKRETANRASRERAEAEENARKAAEEKKRAEEDAVRARSEKERIIAEERAGLLGARQAQTLFEAELAKKKEETAALTEDTLKWRRRTAELIEKSEQGDAKPEDADAFYGELRRILRAARADFNTRLSDRTGGAAVPGAPGVRTNLETVPADPGNETLRSELERKHRDLVARNDAVLWERTKVLNDRVEGLNQDRLLLYPYLSDRLRTALSGLSPEGWDQARYELFHVTLVTRYHVALTGRAVMAGGAAQLVAGFRSLQLFILAALLFWWRRKSPEWISALESTMRSRARPGIFSGTGSGVPMLALLGRIRSSAEWWLFSGLVLWILGPEVSGLYEVRLLWITVCWLLGGSMAIGAADQLLSGSHASEGGDDAGALRLRSLRLVGWTIVTIGLFLALTGEVVGKGTIYSWVASLSYLVPIPITIILVRWWKGEVARRLGEVKPRDPFVAWTLEDSGTVGRFFRMLLGSLYLMGIHLARAVQSYSLRLTLTRRATAYLFRREASKRHASVPRLERVDPVASRAFDPEVPARDFLEGPAASQLEKVLSALGPSGVIALVGERGLGKSSLLRRIAARQEGAILKSVPKEGWTGIEKELAGIADSPVPCPAVLLDDADRLIRPVPGGLAAFDELMSLVRSTNGRCPWVLAFTPGLFAFVERARGRLPVFDHAVRLRPWSEEQIGELILQRTRESGLDLVFDGLLGTAPREDENSEERERYIRERYFRMLWDYSAGNPAVALYLFGESLGRGPEGETRVQLFPTPGPEEFESLPDYGAFVLRRLVELGEASAEDLAAATRISPRQVLETLRHARSRKWIEARSGGYRVAWLWYRALTQALVRRHLLVAGRR